MNLFSYLFLHWHFIFAVGKSFNWASMKLYEWNIPENIHRALKISMIIKYAVQAYYRTLWKQKEMSECWKTLMLKPFSEWIIIRFAIAFVELSPSHLKWQILWWFLYAFKTSFDGVHIMPWNIKCLFYEFFHGAACIHDLTMYWKHIKYLPLGDCRGVCEL